MIFAEIESHKNYDDFYGELLAFIKVHFKNVESGHQGDAYIYITHDGEKVSLDTFSATNFEIKANAASSSLLKVVIDTIEKQYSVRRYLEPIAESFDDL